MLLFPAASPAVIDRALDLDGHHYTVRIDRRAPVPLMLIERGRVRDRFLKKEWKPWDLQIADADGDGRPDIAVGIIKRTRHLPEPHTCLWIIGVSEGHFTRKWLGSTMGRPLLEFVFLDRPQTPTLPSPASRGGFPEAPSPGGRTPTSVRSAHRSSPGCGGGSPLFTLQTTLEGNVALSRYEWSGFGFRKVGQDKIWKKAHGLRSQNGKIVVIGDGKELRFLPGEWK